METTQRTPLSSAHCRGLADAHYDDRTKLMLRSMAEEFDQQAVRLDESRYLWSLVCF